VPRALTPVSFALVNMAVPLFPSFIMLTQVQPPGVAFIPVPVSAVLLALFGVLGIIFTVRLLVPPYPHVPTLRPLLAWLGAGVLSALLGFDPRAGIVFLAIFALGIVWHLSVLRYYKEPFVAQAMAWAMMVACTCSSLVATIMVVLRRPVAQYVIGHGRAIGTFVLPGELAGYLVVLLPIAYGVAVTTRSRSLRACAYAAMATGGIAFVLTFSRAGWMGLAAAAAFLVAVRTRAWAAGMLAAGGIVAGGLLAVLLLFNVAHNPSENYTRLSIWQAALQIVDRFPLTGVGPFEFSHLYALVRAPDGDATAFHAHSVYLTFLAEIGVVGVAAAAWTWWSFGLELWRRIAADERYALLALAAAAGLVGTLVQGLIDTVSVVVFGLWLPTMAFALAAARDGLPEEHA
jgi:O-antigen ligase